MNTGYDNYDGNLHVCKVLVSFSIMISDNNSNIPITKYLCENGLLDWILIPTSFNNNQYCYLRLNNRREH